MVIFTPSWDRAKQKVRDIQHFKLPEACQWLCVQLEVSDRPGYALSRFKLLSIRDHGQSALSTRRITRFDSVDRS